MNTSEYVAKIVSARSIEARIQEYNAPIYERINKESQELVAKYEAEVADLKKRLSIESKSWSSRDKAKKLEEQIKWEEGCINAKYLGIRRKLYEGSNAPINLYIGPLDMTPIDVVFGDITLEQAVEAAKQLYGETPEWLVGMVEAEEYAKCYEVNKVSRKEYVENEYKRHGGKDLGDGMNIVMMNVDDMSYELPWLNKKGD